MKALVLQNDKSLEIIEQDIPQLNAQEVLVSIKASALNHRELWIAKGMYPGMQLPCILGADGAGIITKIGSEVEASFMDKEVIIYPAYDWGENEDAPKKSFRVLGMPDPGTMAEYIKVPISSIHAKPSYLSWEEAAALPVAYLTAWRALTKHGKLQKDQSILITGIGGGVAQAGLAFAKAMHAKVYVTSSSEDKIAQAIEKGATAGVNYKDEEWHLKLKERSNGIDMVLDSSPSENLDNYFKFMNYGGKIVAYGSTGSRKTTINISKFFLRHIQFIGTAMGSPREFQAMLDFMELNNIKPSIDSSYDFLNIKEAFAALASGNQMGKIVIRH